MSDDLPRVAVAGCGRWGRNHVRVMAELGALAAVCDAHPETAQAAAASSGAPARDWADVLADPTIRGLVIASPAALHAAMASEALAAGKAVLVEKPLALSLADGDKLVQRAEAAGQVLMIGHLLLHHPAFEALLALVREGRLGRLRYAWSHRLSLGKVRDEEDVAFSFAPHDLAMLIALFGGEPSGVRGSHARLLDDAHPADLSRIDLRFGDDQAAHVLASWLAPEKEHRLTVIGEDGAAVFEDTAPAGDKLRWWLRQARDSGGDRTPTQAEAIRVPLPEGQPLTRQAQHFLEAVAGRGAVARGGGREALAVLRALHAAEANREFA